MTRNLTSLGLALVAVLAMSVVAASAASAQQGILTTENEEPVTLTAEETGGINRWTVFGLSIQCPGSIGTGHKYSATPHAFIEHGATTFTLTPHVNQAACQIAGLGWTLTTDFNGCDYVTHIGETTGGENTYGGTTEIVCPPGEEILWTVFTPGANHQTAAPMCIIHVPEQADLTGVHGRDTTNGHIDITGEIQGIDATKTKATHPILCPHGTTTSAKLDLDLTVTGRNKLGEGIGIGLSHD